MEEAIDHINTYGTRHSDAIVTRDYHNAERFLNALTRRSVVSTLQRAYRRQRVWIRRGDWHQHAKAARQGPDGLKELRRSSTSCAAAAGKV